MSKLEQLIKEIEDKSGHKLAENIKQSIKLGYNTGYADGLNDSTLNNIKTEKKTIRI